MIPENIRRLDDISELDHRSVPSSATCSSKQFERGRSSRVLGSHNEAYQRVRGLMASEKLFDISREPQKVRDQYGPTQFGEQALVARRLVEAGVPFVRVGRAWWDSHGQNFETHQEMVPELDHVMATLLDDLEERGLLESTLVITLAEFGRTPEINASLGRDHFATAWSATLSGCGIRAARSTARPTRTAGPSSTARSAPAELFATIYQALGIDHQKQYCVGSRPVPLTEPAPSRSARCLRMSTRSRGRPCPTNPKLKVVKELSRRDIVFAVARRPGTGRLFCGGSDFTVYEIDVDQPKPEAKELGRHDSYVTGLALAGSDARLRRLRRSTDLVERRVAVARSARSTPTASGFVPSWPPPTAPSWPAWPTTWSAGSGTWRRPADCTSCAATTS